ncbi:MAG: peptidylprolyl isomerase, partial [Longimicrobiales bacterium]|nr:peptidylprolyl isomerase [Longimicrobiales bacterium]
IASCLGVTLAASPPPLAAQDDAPPTPARVVEEAPDDAWRELDPERTLHIRLATGGEVIVELAPDFAPRHVENILAIVRRGLFDGGAVVRSQDNYVVQWTINGSIPEEERAAAFEGLAPALDAEFTFDPTGLPFTPLSDGDVYAPEVGFIRGFPVARDPDGGRAWVLHCYGVVGVARGTAANSGNGTSLYAVNGHAPRHLDGNLSMPGRVVRGMEHLAVLPRGSGNLGFYEGEEAPVAIVSVQVGSDLPPAERTRLEVMRTDSPSFRAWIDARRHRVGAFWTHSPGAIEICNVGVPTRDP